ACPSREAKAARFCDLMQDAPGASRSTYFRLRKRLAEQGRLTFDVVPPITLGRTSPPGPPSDLELQSAAAMTGLPPGGSREEARPVDVPAREAFAQPVRGPAPPGRPARPVDDSLPWEL